MLDVSELNEKVIFVTGATGLIGQSFIKYIDKINKKNKLNIKIIALVRNLDKANRIFESCDKNHLSFMVSDVCKLNVKKMNIDYILHGACNTSSKSFINEPVETINTSVNGTLKVLELALINKVKSMVYLSSMEVYGSPENEDKIYENSSSNLDTMSVRSCYPESKRICESLCTSYHSEFGVNSMVIRLTQTFGKGVEYDDNRVFAEFARCAIEEKNIVLKTKGLTKRSYLYTDDAVEAVLTVMLRGKPGEAYNAANEETFCSIYDMACMVANICKNKIEVLINEPRNIADFGYAPVLKMNLSTEKLKKLGWKADTDLKKMFEYMIDDMKNRR